MNQKPWDTGNLKVHQNGRYFTCGDTPFFWLADTAWLLFHKLSLKETREYFINRKEKGYHVILADFVHTSDQKNLAGDTALIDEDFSRINLDGTFWDHVDKVVEMAEELGLYLGLLPAWGSCVVTNGSLNMDNAGSYLDFLMERYGTYKHIIWIVGGDVRGDKNPELFRFMGNKIKENCPDNLVTYHPFGRTSSSLWFHGEPWLDFNLFQSGHRRYDQDTMQAWDDNQKHDGCFGEDCWRYVERDYNREPVKPVLDGEPSYECILQGLHDKTQPYWKAADVRRYAYWDVFSGAAGHTYGHNSVMQFYRDLSTEGSFGVRYLWSDAIHHPGCAQMGHLAGLMNSVDFISGRPAQEYLLSEQMEGYDRICIFAGPTYLMCYICTGRDVNLDLSAYQGQNLKAYWFDPVTGGCSFIRELTGGGEELFSMPETDQSQDMVLLLKSE